MIKALFYASALLATMASAEPFNDVCGVPQRNVETIQVVDEGYGAEDPRQYSRGWMTMRVVEDGLIQPWGGNLHKPKSDNSIRRYDAATDSWKVIHPDVGSLYDGGERPDIWQPEAYERWGIADPNPPYILDGRDNALYFYIPDRNEMLIIGSPSKESTWGGVYDFDSEAWTHMWRDLSDWGTQGYFEPYSVPDGKDNYAWRFNAAHVWVDADGPGGEVGMGVAFGGALFSRFEDTLFTIVPSDEPGYVFELKKVSETPPPATGNNRNGAIAAGTCVYFFGGATPSGATDAVWRYNTANGQWTQMAPMPVASQWVAAAYDPATNRVVALTDTAPQHILVYDLEEARWTEITDQVEGLPKRVTRPMLAHAYGRFAVMGNEWHDGDGKNHWTDAARIYRFVVAAETYEFPKITRVCGPKGCDDSDDGYNDWPAKYSKHVNTTWNPINNRYYLGGGDWVGSPAKSLYRQDIWSYEPATDTWRKELPYCVPDGEISWYHPDPVGWLWDEKREVFWFLPGLMPVERENAGPSWDICTTGTYYKWQMLTFDPAAGKFSLPKQPPPAEYPGNVDAANSVLLGSDPIRYGALIRDNTKILRIGSERVAIFDIAEGTWTVRDHNGEDFGRPRFGLSTPVVVGADVYLASRDGGIYRYNLDDQKLHVVDGNPPTGSNAYMQKLGRSLVFYPPWTDPSQRKVWVYDLVTGSWASTPPIRDTASSNDPALIDCPNYENEGCFGTTWEISDEREEMFIFGAHLDYDIPYDWFYLMDLSWLPGPLQGGDEAIATWQNRVVSTPTKEARPGEAKAKENKAEDRDQSSSAAVSPQPQRPSMMTDAKKDGGSPAPQADPPPARPANTLPPAGRVTMEAGVGKPYNLPKTSRLRVDPLDTDRTAGQN